LNAPRRNNNVVIVGAGPAGVCAAAAAAEAGAQATLIDSSPRPGGSVTAALHRSLCGLYACDPGDPRNTLNDSWQRALVERMLAHAPADVRLKQFGLAWVLEFPPAAWEAALASLCAHPAIDQQMNARVTAVRRAGSRVEAIEVNGQWIETPTLIDCTGTGRVLELIGQDIMHSPDTSADRMLGGYGVRLSHIASSLELLRLQIPYFLAKAVLAGELPEVARFTVFHPGPGDGEGVLKLAVHPCDSSDVEVQSLANSVLATLRSSVPDFAIARVVEQSPCVLPRDGRRLAGKYTLTEADVLTGQQLREDAVHAWWPAERWDAAKGPTYAYPPTGTHYDIPHACLQSATVDNLLAAGNCISATAMAAASSRASGVCLATGAAAGRLAALRV